MDTHELGRTGIAIGGMSGSGKTAQVSRLVKMGYNKYSGGATMRSMIEQRNAELAELERLALDDPEIDFKIDHGGVKFVLDNDRFLIEGRCAAHIVDDAIWLNETVETSKKPWLRKTPRILLVCDDFTRFSRIAAREGKSFDQAQDETLAREELIDLRMRKWYNKSLADMLDPEVYDFEVDTAINDEDEAFALIWAFVQVRRTVHQCA